MVLMTVMIIMKLVTTIFCSSAMMGHGRDSFHSILLSILGSVVT